jgi:hypothetical protein
MAERSRRTMHWTRTIAAVVVLAGVLVPHACFARGAFDDAEGSSAQGGTSHSSFIVASSASQCATDALRLAEDTSASFRSVPLSLAMADFTGDRHPDLATVGFDRIDASTGYYAIEIALSEGARQTLQFVAPAGGIFVTAKDVTGDGTLDLVVRAAISRLPVAIFINDGCGHFSLAKPANPDHTNRDAGARSLLPSASLQHAPAVAGLSSRHAARENRSRFPAPTLRARASTAFGVRFYSFSIAYKPSRSPPLA